MERILLASPTMHGDEMKYIQEAFDRNWIAPLGFNCDGFEAEMADFLKNVGEGYKGELYTLSLSSGTGALHLACKLAGIKPGDKVLCSDMTFSATVNPAVYEGAVPIFVDSERESWNMDPAALEKAAKLNPDAKFVILVHLYGTPAKMDEILGVCKKYNLTLIEDAAEALGASYKGRCCGSFGEYNGLSFNGNKIITTSGGGMLITKTAEARSKALFWATQAREQAPWYQHNELGYNYRLSNILAGVGRGQIPYIEKHRQLKEDIYNRYKEGFAARNLPVSVNPHLPQTTPNYWLSCMLMDKGCKPSFMDVYNKLAENNIESRPIWKAMHLQPLYAKNDFVYVENTPVDEDIFSRGLCLPSDIKMTKEQQERVMDVIASCF